MKPRERQSQILDRIAHDGEASVEALAETFDVSPETIRRDLTQLAEAGRLQKVHGGARRMRHFAEGSFDERMGEQAAGKAAIAAKLAALIEPGDVVFIDTGTTTLACAEALAAIEGLTVITNSIRIAQALGERARQGATRVYLAGGEFAVANGETVGPIALIQLDQFRADYAILGAAALDAETGPMDADFDEAAIARGMAQNARKIVIVAHAAKFDRAAAHRICRLDEVDMLVCDQEPGAALAAALAAAKVRVI